MAGVKGMKRRTKKEMEEAKRQKPIDKNNKKRNVALNRAVLISSPVMSLS